MTNWIRKTYRLAEGILERNLASQVINQKQVSVMPMGLAQWLTYKGRGMIFQPPLYKGRGKPRLNINLARESDLFGFAPIEGREKDFK